MAAGCAPDQRANTLRTATARLRSALLDCSEPKPRAVYWREVKAIGVALTPYLDPDSLRTIWNRFHQSPCKARLDQDSALWVDLFEAAGTRNPKGLSAPALALSGKPSSQTRLTQQMIFLASTLGDVANGRPQQAVANFKRRAQDLFPNGELPYPQRVVLAHAIDAAGGSMKTLSSNQKAPREPPKIDP